MANLVGQEFELVAVDRLAEHPDNPRRGNTEALGQSIEINGFFGACVVQRSTGRVLVGNHRYRSAVSKGLAAVPVLWVDVDDARARRIMLADNRVGDLATWDEDALAGLLRELSAEPDGLTGTLFSEDELAGLLVDSNGTTAGDGSLLDAGDVSTGEPVHTPSTGDVWSLGEHVLVVADVLTGWPLWHSFLAGDAVFVPYASPFAPLAERAKDRPLVCVQPNQYLAGHMLDKWHATMGEDPRLVQREDKAA